MQQGRLLDQMKDLGVDQDTVVVFTFDHGDMLGEHAKLNKGMPYETSMGVPFIVKYPRKVLKGKIIETAYSTIDFAPTIYVRLIRKCKYAVHNHVVNVI